MATNYIDSNPEALRNVASTIVTYTTLQYNIIHEYLKQMNSLYQEIETQRFQEILEAIQEWSRRMDELRVQGEGFAAFLNNKADMLDMQRRA